MYIKNIFLFLERNCGTKKYALASILTLLVLALTYLLCPIGFETNDDMGILMIVSGGATGVPSENTYFTNVLWGYFLSRLYEFNAHIPWYIIAYMLLLWGGLLIVCRCCLEIFADDQMVKEVNLAYIKGGALFIAVYMSLFCYSSVLVQFTTMAAFCGLGAILVMKLHPEGKVAAYFLFVVLLFFADTIRPEIGFMTTFALLLMFAAMQLTIGSPRLAYPVLTLLIQGGVYGINYLHYHTNEWGMYKRFTEVRAAWMDYPHVSFEQASFLYEQTGWTRELYDCAGMCFFMDRHVTVDALEKINAGGKILLSSSSNFLMDMVSAFSLISQGTSRIGIAFVFLLLGCLMAFLYSLKQKKYKVSLMIGFMMMVPTTIMLYFGITGRLPYRVAFSVVTLYLVPLGFLSTACILKICQRKTVEWWSRRIVIFSLVFIAASVVLHDGLAYKTYVKANSIRQVDVRLSNMIDEYVMGRLQNIYIIDGSLAISGSPFQVYPYAKPYNRIFWGGSYIYSPIYYEQLRANGLEELYPEKFFAENVYFIGSVEPAGCLIKYMSVNFPSSSVKIVDKQRGFVVYKFSEGINDER